MFLIFAGTIGTHCKHQQIFVIVALYDDKYNEKSFPDKFGSPDAIGYTSNFYNPVATAKYFDSSKENYQVLSNFYAQIDFIPSKLNFKTNYSYSFLSTQGREFTPKYYVSSWQQSATTQLTKNENKYYRSLMYNRLHPENQICQGKTFHCTCHHKELRWEES